MEMLVQRGIPAQCTMLACQVRATNVTSAIHSRNPCATDGKGVQEWFMDSDAGVICTSIVFAMGIDKNNIGQIPH